jgi:hypothetical protein
VNSPPPKPEVILTNFFAEPTVLLVPITSRVELVIELREGLMMFIERLNLLYEWESQGLELIHINWISAGVPSE